MAGTRPGSCARRPGRRSELKKGESPRGDPQFAGYRVDRADAPAVDIQQAGGAFQRLTLALVVFVGALGMVCLLGFLSLAVILAQIVALVLLGFAPVALVIGIFPRGGHEFFRNWLGKLATAVFIKALCSLVIAIVVAVSAALASATESLGFQFAFALQAIFFWAFFLCRRQIAARLVAATTGAHPDGERLPRASAVQRGANIATHPFTALLAMPRRGSDRGDDRQESALAGGAGEHGTDGTAAAGTLGLDGPATVEQLAPAHVGADGHGTNGRAPADGVAANGHRAGPADHAGPAKAHGAGPVQASAANGDGSPAAVPDPSPGPHADGSSPPVAAAPAPVEHERPADSSPRAAHEDVMRRARELRQRQRADGERERRS
jgi:hypothetical protein